MHNTKANLKKLCSLPAGAFFRCVPDSRVLEVEQHWKRQGKRRAYTFCLYASDWVHPETGLVIASKGDKSTGFSSVLVEPLLPEVFGSSGNNFRRLASCAASLNRGDTWPERAPVCSSSEVGA